MLLDATDVLDVLWVAYLCCSSPHSLTHSLVVVRSLVRRLPSVLFFINLFRLFLYHRLASVALSTRSNDDHTS